MALSIIFISLCLVISLSPLGCKCGIQRNPLNDKMEKDILDLHGYILGIRTEMYQDRRNRDDILLRMNETIFRCYGKCGSTDNKQAYDYLTTIQTSMHALQRGLREEKRMNTIMTSKIQALKEENNQLNQALKIMNEDNTENINLVTETLKQINENVNKALQGAMEDKNKMMEVLADIQNLKLENKDLNHAVKDLNEKLNAESNKQLDIMSGIETIKDENQNLGQVLAEIKAAISINKGPVMENGKPRQVNETLKHELIDGDKVPDVIMKNMTDKCVLPSIPGAIYSDNVSRVQVFPGLISSSTQIKVTCESGYFEILGRSHVSRCLTGVWEPDILACAKIVSCATPNISDVIFHPEKTSYEVNETVSLAGCLNGHSLVGAKSLLCLKDGSWHGDAQCTRYCENGIISWETTFKKSVNTTALRPIGYRSASTLSGCVKLCEDLPDCRAVSTSPTTSSKRVPCLHYAENVRSRPEAFISRGSNDYAIYSKLCNDECVMPMELTGTFFYYRDFPYSGVVPDGTVIAIKCQLPGRTAVPHQITCMGGTWNHPVYALSCL